MAPWSCKSPLGERKDSQGINLLVALRLDLECSVEIFKKNEEARKQEIITVMVETILGEDVEQALACVMCINSLSRHARG